MESTTNDRLDDRPTALLLLDAAARLFSEKGYASTSMQEIADAVGILKGSLYYYIDSKNDLLARLVEETQSENLQIVESVRQISGMSALERLRFYVKQQVIYNARNIDKIRVYYRDITLLPEDRRRTLIEDRRGFESLVLDLIEEARESGEVAKDVQPRMSLLCIYSITNWMHVWYRPGGVFSDEELADGFAEFAISGVVNSKGREIPSVSLNGLDANGDE